MAGPEPLQIEIDREENGRFPASVPDLPGVMAYDITKDGAIRRAASIALRVLAETIESGENVPAPLKLAGGHHFQLRSGKALLKLVTCW